MNSIEQPSELRSSFSAGASEPGAGAESSSAVSSGVAPVVGASVFAASSSSGAGEIASQSPSLAPSSPIVS